MIAARKPVGGKTRAKEEEKTPGVKTPGVSGGGSTAGKTAANAQYARVKEHHDRLLEEELNRLWEEDEEEPSVEEEDDFSVEEEDIPAAPEKSKKPAERRSVSRAARVEVEDELDREWEEDEEEAPAEVVKAVSTVRGKLKKPAERRSVSRAARVEVEDELDREWKEDDEEEAVLPEVNPPNTRPLEDVKADMEYWWQRQMDISSQHFAQSNVRRSKRDEEKLAQLKEDMQTARENYRRAEKEYRDHPGYYEDAYQYTNGFSKAAQGIINTTLATIPVLGQVLGNEAKTFQKYFEDDSEDKPGLFDGKLDGTLSALDGYREPIDMNSNAMKLMEEGVWQKNNATENLDGFWKGAADTAIDIGQDAAMLPLLYFDPRVYIAGVAANAAAEEMYGQLAQGQLSNDALTDGVLAAAVEVAKGKLGNVKIPVKTAIDAIVIGGKPVVTDLLKALGLELTEETFYGLLDLLEDKEKNDPDGEFDGADVLKDTFSSLFASYAGAAAEKFLKKLRIK